MIRYQIRIKVNRKKKIGVFNMYSNQEYERMVDIEYNIRLMLNTYGPDIPFRYSIFSYFVKRQLGLFD